MIHSPSPLAPLHSAITALQALCATQPNESDWLLEGKRIMQQLLISDAWLPNSHSVSHPQYYQQHALHIDATNRFSLSSFVWGPNQGTPIHNHTIAGLVGVLRGAEMCQRYSDDGSSKIGEECRLNPGDVDAVSPTIGDVHTVRNAYDDRNSISIHLYRGDIAGTPRNVFKDGEKKPFVSSYSSAAVLA
jgi:3-mercaptopropionate dioxygenase